METENRIQVNSSCGVPKLEFKDYLNFSSHPKSEKIKIDFDQNSFEEFAQDLCLSLQSNLQKIIQPDDSFLLYTSKQVMQILNISKQTLYRMIQTGEIEAYHFGKHNQLRFTSNQIEAAIHPVIIP